MLLDAGHSGPPPPPPSSLAELDSFLEGDGSPEEDFSSSLFDRLVGLQVWLGSAIAHLLLLLILAMWGTPLVDDNRPRELLIVERDLEPPEPSMAGVDLSAQAGQLSEPTATPLDVAQQPDSVALAPPTPRPADPQAVVTRPGPEAARPVFGPSHAGSLVARRDRELRHALAVEGGGSAESEEAVDRALAWLAEHQEADGSWRFEHQHSPRCGGQCGDAGTLKEGENGATALALLPFLGAGQTHLEGRYQETVKRGLELLLKKQRQGSDRGNLADIGGRMYSHGLASIVLCEAYGMTADAGLKEPARMAMEFIGQAQDSTGGGWRYHPRERGDTSVLGWQMMALKSAHLAQFKVPQETLLGASRFLDSVEVEGGANYCYLAADPDRLITPATTSIGVLCGLYLGRPPHVPPVSHGLATIVRTGPSMGEEGKEPVNMYYNYYATQVLHHVGGAAWKKWNNELREFLVARQSTTGHEAGSWFFRPSDRDSDVGGRLYVTSLAAMTLEVYYRYLPLYRQGEGDLPFFRPPAAEPAPSEPSAAAAPSSPRRGE